MLVEPVLYHVVIELYNKILVFFGLLELSHEHPIQHIIALLIYLHHVYEAHFEGIILLRHSLKSHL